MPKVSVNGVALYYEEHGEGVPILGLHGTPGSAALWAGAAVALSNHGRCIFFDRRGFHRSALVPPPSTLDLIQHVDDAAALLAALHAGPAVVIGPGTGGLIALGLARHFPDKVKALVLLEPALFTIDPDADTWARGLRQRVLGASRDRPFGVAEVVMREALGVQSWDALPGDMHEMLAHTSPAVLAEIRGRGLDLSDSPLEMNEDDLADIRRPSLILSAEGSPHVLRLITSRLSGALPYTESVLVSGGHLINPAHPAVLDFVDRMAATPSSWV